MTRATFLGHPTHPTLVVIPLGALPTSLVFDVLFLLTGDNAWFLAALGATVVGEVGILLAMVPGAVDYSSSVPKRGAVRKVATVHMLNGVALAALYFAASALRWFTLDRPSSAAWAALGLNVVGNLLLVMQGYLGGELRTRYALGVDTGGTEARRAAPARRAGGGP